MSDEQTTLIAKRVIIEVYVKNFEVFIKIRNEDKTVFDTAAGNFPKEFLEGLCGSLGIHFKLFENWVEREALRAQQQKREERKSPATREEGKF